MGTGLELFNNFCSEDSLQNFNCSYQHEQKIFQPVSVKEFHVFGENHSHKNDVEKFADKVEENYFLKENVFPVTLRY